MIVPSSNMKSEAVIVGPVLRGHTHWLVSVVFSPDGRRMATSSRDGTVKVWEAQTGRELLTLQAGQHQITSVAFAPDGKRIAAVGQDGDLRIWDAAPIAAP